MDSTDSSAMLHACCGSVLVLTIPYRRAAFVLQAKGFVAGLGAGAAEATLVTTAQETIKIKLIDDQFSRDKPLYRNFFHGVKTIVSESGLSG